MAVAARADAAVVEDDGQAGDDHECDEDELVHGDLLRLLTQSSQAGHAGAIDAAYCLLSLS